jgi:hypothetical protein
MTENIKNSEDSINIKINLDTIYFLPPPLQLIMETDPSSEILYLKSLRLMGKCARY